MDVETRNAIAAAELLRRSVEMFPAIQLFFVAISIALVIHVLREYVGKGVEKRLSPLRFAFLTGLMAAISGATLVTWGSANALYALAFGLGATLSLVDPVAAVGFLMANLLLRPWEMADVPAMGFVPKTLGALALLSWFFHRGRARTLAVLLSWPSRFFFAFTILLTISALASGEDSWQIFTSSMLIAAIVFVLMVNVPEREADLALLQRIFVLSILGSITHALFVTLGQDGFDMGKHRLTDAGLTGNSNDLAALIVQALPIAVIPATLAGKRFGARLIAFVSAPVFLTGLLISQSRGAMISVLLAGGVYYVHRTKNKRRALLMAGFAVPLIFAASTLLNFAREASDLEGSAESRRSFVLAGLNMGVRNPFFGVGFGNFQNVWHEYAVTTLVETGHRTAHNTWVLAFAEAGLPALLLLIGLFWTTFRRANRVRMSHPELLPALAGYTLAMTFLSHTYEVFPYVLVGLVLAAAKINSTAAARG